MHNVAGSVAEKRRKAKAHTKTLPSLSGALSTCISLSLSLSPASCLFSLLSRSPFRSTLCLLPDESLFNYRFDDRSLFSRSQE